jgi:hypothetical protein
MPYPRDLFIIYIYIYKEASKAEDLEQSAKMAEFRISSNPIYLIYIFMFLQVYKQSKHKNIMLVTRLIDKTELILHLK